MAGSSALARKAVLGAVWTIATGLGSRVLGLIGTLVLTRFIAPDVYGEVSAASVVIMTAHFMSSLGTGQFIASRPNLDRQMVFNATVYFHVAGLVAIAAVYLLREPIAVHLVGAPGMLQFMPGLILAMFIDRIWYVPDRLLIREMRFRSVSLRNAAGELTYTAASVSLAMLGWGGNAIVVATLLRAVVRVVTTVPAVKLSEWLTPSPLSGEKARELFAFGIPLNFGSLANFGASKWDNLVMIRLFGEQVGGLYNLAWNLADIPASQVGERIGDVLVPSFAKLEPEQRKAALVRALTLLALLIFPLAVGLGAVAPTILNDTFFNEAWEPAGPLLAVLSALGVTRPIGWVLSSYMQVYGRTRTIMVLEWLKVAAIVGSIALLGTIGGVLWACAGVGVAFGVHALASLWVVKRADGVPYMRLLRPLVRPLLACLPLVVAVLAVRYGMRSLHGLPRGCRLGAEVVVGGLAFVASALVIARQASRDFLQLAREAVRRRR
ncbi:oligosaccharide flippase family protein [Sorangium atrum]|uniref:Oligosaccharide flippase family protein n=1 Tax=Sorangium atrum TaxID=2995308 RepID=A0ABT5C7E1_9BACT|nr:oligosaccharide flippase family protein [Sorangium aterium]MDC0682336.1 oligosaccharide flippase family protein [Sorangium aterium]